MLRPGGWCPRRVRGLRQAPGKTNKACPPDRGAGLVKNDPALTYFRAVHYHRPKLLDCRVRNGNGYFQLGMGTGSRLKMDSTDGWWIEEIATDLSENEVKPIDWLVPVG